jgi:hypothetical protein
MRRRLATVTVLAAAVWVGASAAPAAAATNCSTLFCYSTNPLSTWTNIGPLSVTVQAPVWTILPLT